MTRQATKKQQPNTRHTHARKVPNGKYVTRTPSKSAALAALERVGRIGDAEEQRETLDHLRRTLPNGAKQP